MARILKFERQTPVKTTKEDGKTDVVNGADTQGAQTVKERGYELFLVFGKALEMQRIILRSTVINNDTLAVRKSVVKEYDNATIGNMIDQSDRSNWLAQPAFYLALADEAMNRIGFNR